MYSVTVGTKNLITLENICLQCTNLAEFHKWGKLSFVLYFNAKDMFRTLISNALIQEFYFRAIPFLNITPRKHLIHILKIHFTTSVIENQELYERCRYIILDVLVLRAYKFSYWYNFSTSCINNFRRSIYLECTIQPHLKVI